MLIVRQWVLSSLDLVHTRQCTLVQISLPDLKFQPAKSGLFSASTDGGLPRSPMMAPLINYSITVFVPRTVCLHCFDHFVLSVDVTHQQAKLSFGFLQLQRECIHRCHRSNRSESSVLSLSSSTASSATTQDQRSTTIFTRVTFNVSIPCVHADDASCSE